MRQGLPLVTEEDGPIVLAVPDDPADGLVDSPGRLLTVPLTSRQILQEVGGRVNIIYQVKYVLCTVQSLLFPKEIKSTEQMLDSVNQVY